LIQVFVRSAGVFPGAARPWEQLIGEGPDHRGSKRQSMRMRWCVCGRFGTALISILGSAFFSDVCKAKEFMRILKDCQ
jgi:hypothetical protein